jgi:cell division protein FtsL
MNIIAENSTPSSPTTLEELSAVLLLLLLLQTAIAATMFPHLTTRLFAAKDAAVMRRGMAVMNFRWG